MYYAVIMAGGTGTRLWPLSRENNPKQALRLVGERSMFQYAVERLEPLFPPEHIFVVTQAEHAPLLIGQTPWIPAQNFIVEPEGRGTAPAIGLAAIHLRALDPQAVMAVLTADHFIRDVQGFQQALVAAEVVARNGYLVTLGITPSAPSTGFGYIHQGENLKQAASLPAFRVKKFVEKPSFETAQRMVASRQYSWNSGMFIWQVERIMAEYKHQMPGFHAQLEKLSTSLGQPGYEEAIQLIWPKVGKQTIDYGIMEDATDLAVIPVSIGWTDVGSWGAMFDLLPADADGNTWTGPHIAIDTHGTLAFSEKRLVAAIGLQDLVIVDTPDALLVCSRAREQDVREVVRLLKDGGLKQWL